MTKKLFLYIGLVLLYGAVAAQARDGTSDFQRTKTSQSAVLLYLPYSPAVTTKAFHEFLSKTTNKEHRMAKGYELSDPAGKK